LSGAPDTEAVVLYLWIKTLHIVAVISWMAGMLYLPRLFVYHADARQNGDAAETFKVMEGRLLRGIMNPAAAVSVFAGAWLAWDAGLWRDGWFHAKVALVVILLGFHIFLSRQALAFREDRNAHSSRFYRAINELPAVLMVAIVALVIIKPWL